MNTEISYGKGEITFYRTYARPLCGLRPIPESAFAGRSNVIFAVTVDIEVFGDCFLAAYTEGDNSNLIATDSMKNFVLRQALAFDGATLEGFLAFLGQQFLSTYPQVQGLRLTGKEQPFDAVSVPTDEHSTFVDSDVLLSRSHNDYTTASMDIERDGERNIVTAHRCGREGLQLIKLSGSSFENFIRDAYTSLPEQADRALFIYLDVFWKYTDIAQVIGPDSSNYVAAEQVRDVVQIIFHRFASKSIQHLLYQMGSELLEHFPQIEEVSFVAQNRVWETACVCEADPSLKIYVDPRPPYGMIKFALDRSEVSWGQLHEEDLAWQLVSQPM